MKLTFVLPNVGTRPSGGFKVIYEYANRLSGLGHNVTVVHCGWALLPENIPDSKGLKEKLKNYLRPYKYRYFPVKVEADWFAFANKVNLVVTPYLMERYLSNSDAIVATAWQTAEWVMKYPRKKGKKIYFVQDYEYFMSSSNEIRKRMVTTFQSGMRMVGISPSVISMLNEVGVIDVAYIPNGLDFGIFYQEIPVEDRNRNTIGFPARLESFKGTEDAVKALKIVREDLGIKINVWAFGSKRLDYIPNWVKYYDRPSNSELRELYNKTAIFVVPSHYEGWGLPGSEAMACGAALVSTDTGGVKAYAEHDKTALLSQPKNPQALAANIQRMLKNNELRVRIARTGQNSIQQFTWERAVVRLEHVIREEQGK